MGCLQILDHHLLFSFSSPSLRRPLTSSLSVSFSLPVGFPPPPLFGSFFASSVEVSTFFLFPFHRCEGSCLFLDGLISFVGVFHIYTYFGVQKVFSINSKFYFQKICSADVFLCNLINKLSSSPLCCCKGSGVVLGSFRSFHLALFCGCSFLATSQFLGILTKP